MATLSRMVGFVPTANPERARAFYGDVLGFRLVSDDPFALVFDANGTTLRVTKGATSPPAVGTILGWEVDDMSAAVDDLCRRGVRFEQFGLPFLQQDERGVWKPPGGGEVAWFKDPDGNVLSIACPAQSARE